MPIRSDQQGAHIPREFQSPGETGESAQPYRSQVKLEPVGRENEGVPVG
jgi:hypothetical protein